MKGATLDKRLGSIFKATDTTWHRQAKDSKNALARARRLALKHPGIRIERDTAGEGVGYWVTLSGIAGKDDPLDGNNFCTSGEEVLQAVSVYTTHMKGDRDDTQG